MTQVKVKDTFTDSQSRSVGDKVFDVKSSKDFGGVSDGVTDDTAKINLGLSEMATGVLILPWNTVYTETSIVFPATNNVILMDLSQSGKIRFLVPDTGSAAPITKGGIEIKTQGKDGLLLHTHDAGVAGNPFLELLDSATGNLAGLFASWVLLNNYLDVTEQAAPNAPGVGVARLFVQDNGGGKAQLAVRFNTGAIQVIATQP